MTAVQKDVCLKLYRLFAECNKMFGSLNLEMFAGAREQTSHYGNHYSTVAFSVVREAADSGPLIQRVFVVHRSLENLLSLRPIH